MSWAIGESRFTLGDFTPPLAQVLGAAERGPRNRKGDQEIAPLRSHLLKGKLGRGSAGLKPEKLTGLPIRTRKGIRAYTLFQNACLLGRREGGKKGDTHQYAALPASSIKTDFIGETERASSRATGADPVCPDLRTENREKDSGEKGGGVCAKAARRVVIRDVGHRGPRISEKKIRPSQWERRTKEESHWKG